jgi:hypothetical protein
VYDTRQYYPLVTIMLISLAAIKILNIGSDGGF